MRYFTGNGVGTKYSVINKLTHVQATDVTTVFSGLC